MNWVKFGIVFIGYVFVGLLPNAVKKSLRHVKIDLERQTLSFLSNEDLYGKDFQKGYTMLLFLVAILWYAFFWLLTKYYDLGKHERLVRRINFTFAALAFLAFMPHNVQPYSWSNFGPSFERLMHNILAVVVFVSIPVLIATFQTAILKKFRFMAITGWCILGSVVLSMAYLLVAHGLNGIAEIFFVNGISVWIIFVSFSTALLRESSARRQS